MKSAIPAARASKKRVMVLPFRTRVEDCTRLMSAMVCRLFPYRRAKRKEITGIIGRKNRVGQGERGLDQFSATV